MNKINNKRNVIIVLLLLISIGFAYLSTNLNIIGASIVHSNTWQVIWDDTSVDVISGSVTANTPTIDSNKTTVSYDITLNSPGDYYEFSVDAFNNGSINAMVSLITFTYKENNSTVTLPSCIKHTVKYADGRDVELKDLLEAGQKQKYYINIEYDRDVTSSNMITTNRVFTVTVKIDYEQADNTAVAKEINSNTICLNNKHQEITSNIVCKRASVLHTEKCLNEDDTGYCQAAGYQLNEDIIYGNCGTIGTLTPGDAFDCDVDGNGIYDTQEERFYYVSPKDADESSECATLIYFKDITRKNYNLTPSYSNNIGPVTLLNELPSITDWPKVSLTNNGTRQIVNELGGTTTNNGVLTIQPFTYTNRASRLITYQEILYATGSTNLDENTYLMENTTFSDSDKHALYFLETPISVSSTGVYTIYVKTRVINGGHQTIDLDGVRPAIEVPLKNISY